MCYLYLSEQYCELERRWHGGAHMDAAAAQGHATRTGTIASARVEIGDDEGDNGEVSKDDDGESECSDDSEGIVNEGD